MSDNEPKKEERKRIISKIDEDGAIVEMIINDKGKSQFAIYVEKEVLYQDDYLDQFPWSAYNNLITSQVLKFPSEAKEYGTNKELFDRIIEYLKKYIELPDHFYNIVAIYCMMTWVYEQFSEVAYLRVLGDFGTGKTRFIKTIGNICYKPMIASGSATPSSLFRIIDLVGGTFVFDEADFQGSDMWKEMVKILNSGHTAGGPVLRTERQGKDGEFSPKAFKVFGPKVIASRKAFDDEALESRCLTEVMVPKVKLENAPIHLPAEFKQNALQIRNMLLMFRFKNFNKIREFETEVLTSLDPRMQQTALSILAVAQSLGDRSITEGILDFLESYNKQLKDDRGDSQAVDVLQVVANLMFSKACNGTRKDKEKRKRFGKDPHGIQQSNGIKISIIAAVFNNSFGLKYDIKREKDSFWSFEKNHLTPKKVGEIIRRDLRITTRRQKGGYFVPLTEASKVKRILDRYGITEENLREIKCSHG